MTKPPLDTSFRLGSKGDEVYAALIEAHRGLDDEASARLNVRLVLILANAIGDPETVLSAIAKARAFTPAESPGEASG